MGINTAVLPSNSDAIATAFQVAMELANVLVNQVSPIIYTLMVYNLGGSNIINFAPDVAPPVVYLDGLTYFAYWRKFYGITSFVGGTISTTSDEGTSESLNVPENLTRLTLADLQYLKDPWGRQYLAFAEKYGQIWSLS
jgi:hypothetical protein